MTSGLMLVTSSTIIIKHENGDLKTFFFSTDDNKLCCISPFLLVGCFFVNIYLLDGILMWLLQFIPTSISKKKSMHIYTYIHTYIYIYKYIYIYLYICIYMLYIYIIYTYTYTQIYYWMLQSGYLILGAEIARSRKRF